MPGRDRLQREQRDDDLQISRTSALDIRMQVGERKGDPLDSREVQLAQPEEARGREGEDDPTDERAGHTDADAPRKKVGADTTQKYRQERDDIQREEGIAGHPDDRRRDQSAADQVLRKREGVLQRIKDVGVEEMQRLIRKGMRQPGERPQKEMRIRVVPEDHAAGADRQRIGENGGENREDAGGRPEFPRPRRIRIVMLLSAHLRPQSYGGPTGCPLVVQPFRAAHRRSSSPLGLSSSSLYRAGSFVRRLR